MTWYSLKYGLLPCAVADRDYLEDVKTGFGRHGLGANLELLLWLAALTLLVVLLILLISRWLKPAKLKVFKGKIDLIESRGAIRETIDRAVTARAVFEIEVFDEAYKETYKGLVLGITPKGNIDVEINSYIDPNLDFKNKPLAGNFRIALKGENEFYRFNATSLGIGYSDTYGRRLKLVRLTMPLTLEKSQKRQFNRIEPAGRFGFAVEILNADITVPPIPLDYFKPLHKTVVRDISLGGMQVVMIARGEDIRIQADDEVFALFRLPRKDLKLPDINPEFLIKVKVISVIRVQTGRRVMSQEADLRTSGPYNIKLQFLSKGIVQRKTRVVDFPPVGSHGLEDLGQWLQAYQRFLIQKEKDTLPQPGMVRNLYPRRPPDVEPKYPSIPYKRKGSSEIIDE